LTISSHLPYLDPYEKTGTTSDKVWSYVDRQIGDFYERLKRLGFFKNGILIITGDHRKMLPVSQDEYAKYGDRAAARVPLAIVGKQIPQGRIDIRLWSQVDLFAKLRVAVESHLPLSSDVVFTERKSVRHRLESVLARIRVFTGAGDFVEEVEDTKLSWDKDKRPNNFREIESRIHTQRAALQYGMSLEQKFRCKFEYPSGLTPSSQTGVELLKFKGQEIEELPSIDRLFA